jgi:hypothetical protein
VEFQVSLVRQKKEASFGGDENKTNIDELKEMAKAKRKKKLSRPSFSSSLISAKQKKNTADKHIFFVFCAFFSFLKCRVVLLR